MKNTEAVHQLIQALSKAEKRHFKMTAARYSKNQNNYVLLFDAIDHQEVYNENKLRKKFKNQTFGQNIGKTKYLLYELLLKSLRPLYNSKNTLNQLQGLLQSIDFLLSKCLYDQAAALLKKAKKQALHYQLFPDYLKALSYEKKLLGHGSKPTNAKQVNDLLEEYDRISGLVRMEMRYQVSSEKLHLLSMTMDQEEWIQAIEKELEKLPVEEYKCPSTFLCSILRKEIMALQAYARRDHKASIHIHREIYTLWKENIHLVNVFPDHFSRTSERYIHYLLFFPSLIDELQEAFAFLKEHQPISNDEQAEKNALQYLIIDFIINLTQGNQEICSVLMLSNEEYLPAIQRSICQPLQVQFYYHIAIFYFLKKDFDEALNWALQLKEVANQALYPRSQKFCQLIELIARYELEEYEYLECAVRNRYRSLCQEPQKNEIEKLVLRSVKKLLKVSHRSEVHHIFADLHDALQKAGPIKAQQDNLETSLLFQWINKYLSQENTEYNN